MRRIIRQIIKSRYSEIIFIFKYYKSTLENKEKYSDFSE
ncbi:MAG: hypothetical protein AB9882_06365 [Ignavibacteriaceae bacterium]